MSIKKKRLEVAGSARRRRLLALLQNRAWPKLPKGASRRWIRKQEERLLGFGKYGESA